MYRGTCLCGQVAVQVDGNITDIIHCHCSLCRKNSGTAYATNGFVNTDEFVIIKGEENLSHFSFKPGKYRHFCRTCGSPIYSSNDQNPAQIRLRLGLLDSDISERPISHNFVTSKANWDELDAELPRYDSFEPTRNK